MKRFQQVLAACLSVLALSMTAACSSAGDQSASSAVSGGNSYVQESTTSPEADSSAPAGSSTASGSTQSDAGSTPGKTTAPPKQTTSTVSNKPTEPPVVWVPGKDMIPDSAMKLPDMDIKNKTVTILTHGGKIENLEKFEEKYGIEVVYDIVPSTEKATKLQKLVAANTSPDLYWAIFSPTLITRNYVQSVDPYIDFDSDLWKGTKDNHEVFMWSGKHYFVVPRFYKNHAFWYNKDIFDEAGEDTPLDLYRQGKWDWDAMERLAKSLTIDADKNGTPEQWGIETTMGEALLYTTGKDFVSYNKNGTAINNIKSPEVARAITFLADLANSGCIYDVGNGMDAFASGKVAMSLGHLWYRDPYKELIATDSLGYVPLPRDPDADHYYTGTEAEAYYIVRGAKNPEGAAALLCALRINEFDTSLTKKNFDSLVSKGLWNQEFEDMYNEIQDFQYTTISSWATFDLGGYFGDFFTRPKTESWSKIAEEIAPAIDAQINRLYSTNQK